MSFGIGQPVRRTEDPRFLTGTGAFIDDITPPNMAFAQVFHANVAHANIKSIESAAALVTPGVLAVLTGADAEADGLGSIPPEFMPEDMDGPSSLLGQAYPFLNTIQSIALF